MINRNLILLDGRILTCGYERIVHGGRGDYVEFTKKQLVLPLKSKFNQRLPEIILGTEYYYYYWLISKEGFEYKIYWQIKTVKYADYKIGFYYIDPKNIRNFVEENR